MCYIHISYVAHHVCGHVFYSCKATTVGPGLLLYNLSVRAVQMPHAALSEVDNQSPLGVLVLQCETERFGPL